MIVNIFQQIWKFYYDGFRSMSTWGKQIWIIILIKLAIMFLVLKLFFFPNFLNTNFSTEEQKSKHVLENLTNTK